MNANEISQRIEEWIRLSFLLPGVDDRDHCHGLKKDFTLPGCPALDFLSFRHQEPLAYGAPDLFTVSVWKVVRDPVTSHHISDLGTSILLLRAAYAQILEDAECRGWHRRHRLSVQGNIIGGRFERNPLIDTLSVGGGEMAFWTFTIEGGRLEIQPYYIDGQVVPWGSQLQGILDHLTWAPREGDSSVPRPRPLLTLDGVEAFISPPL